MYRTAFNTDPAMLDRLAASQILEALACCAISSGRLQLAGVLKLNTRTGTFLAMLWLNTCHGTTNVTKS
jgi:hypothetical protein